MNDVKVLSESECLDRIDRKAVLTALETAFAGLSSGRSVQPNQTLVEFSGGEGDCIFYPGALLDLGLIGVKVSPYIQSLADAGKYPVTAYTLLLSSVTGLPVVLCDSYALTTIRTAATTALAVKYLVGHESPRLGIIGSGRTAREHLRFALELDVAWSSLSMWSPNIEGVRDELMNEFEQLEIVDGAESLVRSSDVVMLCTSATKPIVDEAWFVPGAVVCSISTSAPNGHEINPSSLASLEVYADYRLTAPTTAGEMILSINANSWSGTMLNGDLAELIDGRVTPSSQTKFFRSTGLGIEDLAIASLLV